MRAAVAVLAALGIAAAACGRKSAPVPPELVQPEPPGNLAAAPTAEGVRLTWLRPVHYSGGQRMNDLGSFVIERAAAEGPAEFRPVGSVELTDQTRFRKERRLEWLDRDVPPGARYLYRVTAVTLDGYRSAPAGPVGP